MPSKTSNSRRSAPLSSTQIARFHELQERHQRLKISMQSGADAQETGTGSAANEADSSTKPSICMKGGLELDLFERLARLATTEPPLGRPPLETYTTTPTAHGDIFRATHEFRGWIRSRYRGYGVGDYAAVEAPGPPPKAMGGIADPDDF